MQQREELPCPTAPTRFFIGTQKAGSSYLYHLLASHPEITLAPITEVNFFGKAHARDLGWYCDQFALDGYAVDVSPAYFRRGKPAAEQIARTYGGAQGTLRFVLFLRNPIEYLQSHFTMHLRQGYFAHRPEQYPVVPQSVAAFVRRYPEYLASARYHTLLEEWLQVFSREQFLIIPFERFIHDEEHALREMLAFWGIPYEPMHAPATTQNRALRFPFFYRVRDWLATHPTLAEALRSSAAAQWMYHHVAAAPSARLAPPERAELAARLADEVTALAIDGVDTSYWSDFVAAKER